MGSLEPFQISPFISADEAFAFYQEHGLYYVVNADIGECMAALGKRTRRFPHRLKPLLEMDPRLERFVEQNSPIFSHPIREDRGFYALTVAPPEIAKSQIDRVVIYVFYGQTTVDVFPGSHDGELIGSLARNGLVEIPSAFLLKKGLLPRRIDMGRGGVLVVHPRLGIRVVDGDATGYGCIIKNVNSHGKSEKN